MPQYEFNTPKKPANIDQQIAEVEARLDSRISKLQMEMNSWSAQLSGQIAELLIAIALAAAAVTPEAAVAAPLEAAAAAVAEAMVRERLEAEAKAGLARKLAEQESDPFMSNVLPTYATSLLHSGRAEPLANVDLNGIRFLAVSYHVGSSHQRN